MYLPQNVSEIIKNNIHMFIYISSTIIISLIGIITNSVIIYVTFINVKVLTSKSNYLIGVMAVYKLLGAASFIFVCRFEKQESILSVILQL